MSVAAWLFVAEDLLRAKGVRQKYDGAAAVAVRSHPARRWSKGSRVTKEVRALDVARLFQESVERLCKSLAPEMSRFQYFLDYTAKPIAGQLTVRRSSVAAGESQLQRAGVLGITKLDRIDRTALGKSSKIRQPVDIDPDDCNGQQPRLSCRQSSWNAVVDAGPVQRYDDGSGSVLRKRLEARQRLKRKIDSLRKSISKRLDDPATLQVFQSRKAGALVWIGHQREVPVSSLGSDGASGSRNRSN